MAEALEAANSEEDRKMSAEEIQQAFYETIGDFDWELFWTYLPDSRFLRFEKKDRKHLLQKIAIALCGPPSKEGNLLPLLEGNELQRNELKLQGYTVREEETCLNVFKKIWEQASYSHNGENVLISILRIVLVTPKEVGFFKKTPKDHWDNLHLKRGDDVTICVFHVFCVRRCVSMSSDIKSCRIYIDHDGRVYKTWQGYLEENLLPKGIMVVPENGEYRGSISIREIKSEEDIDSIQELKVKLTVLTSPALGLGARILNAADITSTAANIGALGALIGAAFAAPVVAPFLIAGAVTTGVATGIYAIVRSSINLADRGNHEQEIGLDNAEARGMWINIIISTFGISFSAAAKLVAWAAASGTNIKILMNALTFLRYSNMATGIVAVANNLADMITKYNKYKETPSGLELFQFTTSCLFLGIGVMSNATAQEIVQDAQANTINEARDALTSNAKRKAFDKVTAENRRTLGTINGNAETIRGLKVITDKNDFFAKIARMNKDMNRNKVRVSLTSEGTTLINSKHEVSLPQLYEMGKGGRNELFSKLGPADTSTKNAPTRIYASSCNASTSSLIGKSAAIDVDVQDVIAITQFILKLCKADKEFVAEILSQISAEIHNAFLTVCVRVASKLVPGDPHMSARVVYFVFDYIKSKVGDCDYENDHIFFVVLKTWIKNGRVDEDVILMLYNKFMENLSQRKEIGAFYNDPNNYDYVQEYRKRYKQFMTLRAGEVVSIGSHKIVMKASTVEALEEWLVDYTQEQSDLILEFILKVVHTLTPGNVNSLTLINPDEDVILRVAYYLFMVTYVPVLLIEFVELGVRTETALQFQVELLEWMGYQKQSLRKHKICDSCKGLLYKF